MSSSATARDVDNEQQSQYAFQAWGMKTSRIGLPVVITGLTKVIEEDKHSAEKLICGKEGIEGILNKSLDSLETKQDD